MTATHTSPSTNQNSSITNRPTEHAQKHANFMLHRTIILSAKRAHKWPTPPTRLSHASLCHLAHVADTHASFHWLRAPERIRFKLAVIIYWALHGSAPCFLSGMPRRVADIPSRNSLQLSSTTQLVVRPSRLAAIRDRSFASSGLRHWSNLAANITAAPSLPELR